MLKQYLAESLTSKLYRIERIFNFYNTVKDNKFYPTHAIGSQPEIDINKNKLYFLSLMRTKNNAFTAYKSDCFVRMTLDGQKFNHNFKSIPVNYWQDRNPTQSESEDRIVTDKPYIDNALSYITKAEFCIDENIVEFTTVGKCLEIFEILKKNDIPFVIYTSKQGFQTSNVKQSTTFENFKNRHAESAKLYNGSYKYEINEKLYEEMKRTIEWYKLFIESELFNRNKEAYDEEVQANWHFKDFVSYMKNGYIHAKSSFEGFDIQIENKRFDKEYRDLFHEFFVYLKKNGIQQVQDVVEMLENNGYWDND